MFHSSGSKHLVGLAFTKEFLLPRQVLDPDNLVGVVQIENILIFAESYDVALDISFPKGLLTPSRKGCLEVTSFRQYVSCVEKDQWLLGREVEFR